MGMELIPRDDEQLCRISCLLTLWWPIVAWQQTKLIGYAKFFFLNLMKNLSTPECPQPHHLTDPFSAHITEHAMLNQMRILKKGHATATWPTFLIFYTDRKRINKLSSN